MTRDFLDLTVRELLEEVAAPTPAPGAGSVVAVAAGLAASLAAMAAGLSADQLEDSDALVSRAREAQARVSPLAQRDADAYAAVLAAMRRPKDDPGRAHAVQRALEEASDIPLEVAEAAAGVVELAERVASQGNPRLRGDALAAASLARSAVEAAATLVELNLPESDAPRRVRARALTEVVRTGGRR